MLQHMTLMMVAPPLILLAEPLIPMLRGMPRFAAREFAGPFLNWPVAERTGVTLANPVVALVLMGVVMFAWHVPGLFELALRSSSWHQAEHACFFFASIVFWWPVVQPWPSRAQRPRWAMLPYLLIADLQNTALSAVLVFSDKLLYPSYALSPRLFGLTAQEDQAAAGAIMWVVGSLAFIVPAVLIAVQCLRGRRNNYAERVVRRNQAAVVTRLVSGASRRCLPRRLLGERMSPGAFEAASFVLLFIVIVAGFAVLPSADDDDQVLRLHQQSGPLTISVYGPAGDLPVGPATFAVLVQDSGSQEVILGSDVEASLQKVDEEDPAPQPMRALPAAENKLLLSAEMPLPSPGRWVLEVTVRQASGTATVSMPVKVVQAAAGLPVPRSFMLILALATALSGFYAWRRRTRASAGLAAPAT
jgi:cytochrome c oxidase assembly factor CtaG